VTFNVYLPDGVVVDLGPTVDVLRAFSHIGRLEADDEFGHLHGLINRSDEDLTEDDLALLRTDATRFLAKYEHRLSELERSMLRTITAQPTSPP
jgi:hypothetical protein